MANRVYGYQGYSKGYQFETSPRKLQPEFEPDEEEQYDDVHEKRGKEKTTRSKQTRTKSVSKRKKLNVNQNDNNVQHHKLTKAQVKRNATVISYILFGFAILFTISYRNSIINEKFNEKENLKTQFSDIQKTNEQLEVSVENELNLTNIEKIAKEQLGMSKLNNDQKVYVSLPKREYVESSNTTTSGTDVIESCKELFDKAIEFFK